jgi:predicted enzyme related to lactoylglutathione lyase
MSERDDYPHGVPCWVSNLAPDVPAAMEFYGELFGWSFEINEAATFAVGRLRGRDVAGIGALSEAGPDARAAWITEVRVDSAQAAAEDAARAGGNVLAGPMELAPAGRLTVIADPFGAVICAWEAGARKGAQVVNEPGAWSMSALTTPDTERAAAFYGAMFGWEREPFGPMTMWRCPGYVGGEEAQPVPRDVVAVMAPQDPAADARWGVDFWIADADAAAATTERRGGRVLSAPADAGPFRSATLADPAGAAFTVTQLIPGA